MTKHHTFIYDQEFELESGQSLPEFRLRYTTFGKLNEAKDNIIWVCHAFTGSSDFTDWWKGMFGPGMLYDPERHFVICANAIGGCYGSTGPLSVDPNKSRPYFHDFPSVTNRDIIRAFDKLRQHLGFEKLHTLIGCSMGGQQALEWAVLNPGLSEHLIVIGSNAKHSPWGIAFNESQRMAIEQDPTWQLYTAHAGMEGMKVARSIALISYRNYQTYDKTQYETDNTKTDDFKASSYQRYQGLKLANRFNAFTYWTLSKAMDSQNVGRGRDGVLEALATVKAKALFIGMSSDLLFPMQEQHFLTKNVPGAVFEPIHSDFGHDGFLLETEQLTDKIRAFYWRGLRENRRRKPAERLVTVGV
ncbi:homoserine O-acetyltransferase [Fulvitalea axinellae]|uniref:Homoserine O-acetyltransferase n=1 Tax=Fulvitalea axinellae TaxID=1182444 RepID=A0AAU9D5K9_9BACT|nr:homoserine O-acetyltransferase [Fulvitalea axinellae]